MNEYFLIHIKEKKFVDLVSVLVHSFSMVKLKRLWILLATVVGVSFTVLLYFGGEIYRQAPPIAKQVVVENTGEVLFTEQQVKDGQNVWQSTGGQQLGSVWGHGSYVAPDWTADWLHREAVFMLDAWAKEGGASSYDSLNAEQQAALKARLKKELRTNRYDPATGTLTVSVDRAAAIRSNSNHYSGLFGGSMDGDLPRLREAYAMMERTIKDPARLQPLSAFLFWASWACMTERPDEEVTYTNNWPHEPLIDNQPSGNLMLWTGFSVIMRILSLKKILYWGRSLHHPCVQH